MNHVYLDDIASSPQTVTCTTAAGAMDGLSRAATYTGKLSVASSCTTAEPVHPDGPPSTEGSVSMLVDVGDAVSPHVRAPVNGPVSEPVFNLTADTANDDNTLKSNGAGHVEQSHSEDLLQDWSSTTARLQQPVFTQQYASNHYSPTYIWRGVNNYMPRYATTMRYPPTATAGYTSGSGMGVSSMSPAAARFVPATAQFPPPRIGNNAPGFQGHLPQRPAWPYAQPPSQAVAGQQADTGSGVTSTLVRQRIALYERNSPSRFTKSASFPTGQP